MSYTGHKDTEQIRNFQIFPFFFIPQIVSNKTLFALFTELLLTEYVFTQRHHNNNYTFTAAPQGTYSYVMECWGAQGGNDTDKNDLSDIGYGGKGGYTKGTLSLTSSEKLYIYVGEGGWMGTTTGSLAAGGTMRPTSTNHGGWTSGSKGCGGGSVDIRLVNGNWDNFASLKSRIMVAGGGGGAENNKQQGNGGAAGGTSGLANSAGTVAGGTQTSGYGFGVARTEIPTNGTIWGAGGNGYYSGQSSTSTTGGGGGSSFISGHPGCNAISASSTSANITHTGSPNHYSGKVFTSTQMIAGNATQTKPGGGTETGHSGNGYARITLTRW